MYLPELYSSPTIQSRSAARRAAKDLVYSNILPHTGRGGRTPVFGSLPGIVKHLDALHGGLKSDALVGGAQPLGVEEGGVLAIPQVVSCPT